MKKILLSIALACTCIFADAQTELKKLELAEELSANKYTNEFLDTVNIKKKLVINDYSMIGFHYGVNLSRVMWNPSQKQDMLMLPFNAGITYTRYGRMFGYMPYFGFQAGLLYTQEGYQFKYNEDKDYTYTIEGAEKAVYDVVELPLLCHIHYDLWNFKLIVDIGCYAGYRLGIHRYPGKTGIVSDDVRNSFLDTDRRWDYGVKAGAGFGLVFDPIEIHFTAIYKHSFGTLYDPNYYSEVYYRYAYPSNITISAGIHFHLSKRTGKTKSDLKKAAKEMVYGTKIN